MHLFFKIDMNFLNFFQRFWTFFFEYAKMDETLRISDMF